MVLPLTTSRHFLLWCDIQTDLASCPGIHIGTVVIRSILVNKAIFRSVNAVRCVAVTGVAGHRAAGVSLDAVIVVAVTGVAGHRAAVVGIDAVISVVVTGVAGYGAVAGIDAATAVVVTGVAGHRAAGAGVDAPTAVCRGSAVFNQVSAAIKGNTPSIGQGTDIDDPMASATCATFRESRSKVSDCSIANFHIFTAIHINSTFGH